METQPEPLPQDDESFQKWQRIFAENNRKNQTLMAEAIWLLEERTKQCNAASAQ